MHVLTKEACLWRDMNTEEHGVMATYNLVLKAPPSSLSVPSSYLEFSGFSALFTDTFWKQTQLLYPLKIFVQGDSLS